MDKAFLTVTWSDGVQFSGTSPQEVLHAMKLTDWTRPKNDEAYKSRVQESVATIEGVSFLYWDASSFLMGLQAVGLVTLTWEVRA